ncbi:hypothetical protein BJX63DRAFT_403197 [Aspergillus granulosus]|uniref:Secreted protein n=1 Tax=Aspergillus granulosus TaxID=176169 RepID=A0ABR4H3S6_9EURO
MVTWLFVLFALRLECDALQPQIMRESALLAWAMYYACCLSLKSFDFSAQAPPCCIYPCGNIRRNGRENGS